MTAADSRTRRRRFALGLAVLALAATCVGAQPFDVPYVSTPQIVVEEMLRLAAVGKDDFLIDLGSGDGRIAITAASHFGARALGVDIDPGRIAESRENAKAAGVSGRVEFVNGNLFDLDLSPASVVTMYLLPELNLRLRPKLLETLKPGTRVVSHAFTMGDWKPDRHVAVERNIYLWTIPATVAGRWRLEADLPGVGQRSYQLEVRQKYQEILPVAKSDDATHPVWEAKLEGTSIRFIVIDGQLAHRFEGEVAGKSMHGIVRTGVGSAEVETPFQGTWIGAL